MNDSVIILASCLHKMRVLLVFSSFQYVNELFFTNFLVIVENIGVEPMTSCVQGRRSSQLS